MKIKDIDKIFCVNLQQRTDRRKRCEEIFSSYNMNVEFFSAIDGKKLNLSTKITPGHVGCCLSHREIFKLISTSSWENILILEDDIEFVKNFDLLFEEYYDQVPDDWNMIYFGGNHNRQKYNYISKNVHRLSKTYTTHCYMIRKKCVSVLLEEFDDAKIFNQEVDVHLSNVQKKIPCYGFLPHLAWQRESFSDIENKNTNYEFLKDNSLLG